MASRIAVDIVKRFPGAAEIRARFTLDLNTDSPAVLFGPSGTGKTTVLRSIAGLEQPTSGTIVVDGETWFDASRRFNLPVQSRKVGLLFQDYALFPHLSVRRNIEYGVHHKHPRERRLISDEMLNRFEIVELADRMPREISGGQAQRVALARAVAPHPRILLLDEPLAALDSPTRARLRMELRRLLERIGIPTIMVTHDRSEAITIGRHLIVLSDGLVRQTGPVNEVFQRPIDSGVALALGVETIVEGEVLDLHAGLASLRVPGSILRAVPPETLEPGRRVLVCIRAEEVNLQPVGPHIESARNHLTGRIEAIVSDGPIERVTVHCGFPLVAVITRNAREDLRLEPGDPIVASVKATAIHLIPL